MSYIQEAKNWLYINKISSEIFSQSEFVSGWRLLLQIALFNRTIYGPKTGSK